MYQSPTDSNLRHQGSMRAGDVITITALKSDGRAYRWWDSIVESTGKNHLVTLSILGDPVLGPCGGWTQRQHIRTFYWFDRPYNLMEVYEDDGRLKQVFIHIASVPMLRGHALVYTDHELDVVRRCGGPVRVVDEDEFMEAAHTFGYSPEFQASCRQAVTRAMQLISRWRPLGPPTVCRRSSNPRANGTFQTGT